jgi:hypothetical protein
LLHLALVASEAGEARRGSQLPLEGALPARPVERFPEAIFGLRCGGLFTQHQVTFDAKQFSEQPPFIGLLASLDGLPGHGQSISNLASTAQGTLAGVLEPVSIAPNIEHGTEVFRSFQGRLRP